MRIVGGAFKGRTLFEFKGQDIRPTSDMARESLFNVIKDKIIGAKFLDLYCGTGAVGIEALSRGAIRVVFNDLSRESIKLTKKNLEKVDKENLANKNSVSFQNLDALNFLKSISEKFDVVFIDAPYNSESAKGVITLAESVLTENGIIVYEDEKFLDFVLEKLELFDKRKYGRAVFTFFRKK